jgi:DNA-binding GntR family transcriptional regulator
MAMANTTASKRPTRRAGASAKAGKVATAGKAPAKNSVTRGTKKKAAPTATREGGVSLSEHAHRALTAMIAAGALAPNDVITERQLALQLGVSRTPLREAIGRLEGAGLLNRQRSGALVVRALPIEEYIFILQARRLLEGEAAQLAAGHLPAHDVERLRQRAHVVLSLPDDVPLPDAMDGLADEEDLHAVVAAACGNPVLQELLEGLRLRTSMFRFGRLPVRRREVIQEHLAIVEALAAGDAQQARSTMEHHIDRVRETLIARLGGRAQPAPPQS